MFARGRLDHFALRAASIEQFEALRDELMRRECTDGFVTDFGQVLSVFFRDPEGLELELCVANPDAVAGRVNPPGTGTNQLVSGPSGASIFDTSAVIGLVERRAPGLIDIVTQLGRPIIRSTTVTGQLQHGAAVDGPGTEQRADTLDRYLRLSVWPDIEIEFDELARLYGVVSATSAQPELRAGMNDRWVVAECLAFGVGLVTSDVRQARLATAVAGDTGLPLSVTIAT